MIWMEDNCSKQASKHSSVYFLCQSENSTKQKAYSARFMRRDAPFYVHFSVYS